MRSNALNIAVEWRFTGGSSVTLEGNLGNPNDIYCWIDVRPVFLITPMWDLNLDGASAVPYDASVLHIDQHCSIPW